jgi:phosphonopyruvate decarboxylase
VIAASSFVKALQSLGVDCFAGVPDSLMKPLTTEIARSVDRAEHVIAANEGAAVAVAIGHHLRTGRVGLVYLQNSGIGNTVNPLLSLADPEVYGIPMVLVIGWRGAPGVKDEPQHVKQGRVMTAFLDAMEIPWTVLPKEQADAERCAEEAFESAAERKGPVAILVEKGTFATDSGESESPPADLASREDAVVAVVKAIGDDTINVATTGMLGRELFEYRQKAGGGEADFLTVGGMGHASSIAFGIAMHEHEREIWCLDGDGALLMHLGTLAVVGDHAPANYFHVVFNNEVHDSVGGQPTSISAVDLMAMAKAAGYRAAFRSESLDELPALVGRMRDAGGPSLLEIRVRPGSRADLGRPTRTPAESKVRFMSSMG